MSATSILSVSGSVFHQVYLSTKTMSPLSLCVHRVYSSTNSISLPSILRQHCYYHVHLFTKSILRQHCYYQFHLLQVLGVHLLVRASLTLSGSFRCLFFTLPVSQPSLMTVISKFVSLLPKTSSRQLCPYSPRLPKTVVPLFPKTSQDSCSIFISCSCCFLIASCLV